MHPTHRNLIALIVLTTLLALPLAAQGATSTFCVSGNSDGVGWSWGIVIMGSLQSSAVVEPVEPGAGCEALTAAFVQSINEANEREFERCEAEVLADNPCCFTITCKGDLKLFIGDEDGDPSGDRCEVTPEGCKFNPLVFQVPSDAF